MRFSIIAILVAIVSGILANLLTPLIRSEEEKELRPIAINFVILFSVLMVIGVFLQWLLVDDFGTFQTFLDEFSNLTNNWRTAEVPFRWLLFAVIISFGFGSFFYWLIALLVARGAKRRASQELEGFRKSKSHPDNF
ncbi:MAG: hypothetical protein KC421_30055 [Anaerolineales bacterium]|nr:hypothetical protein [Anaerolineales bacterium]